MEYNYVADEDGIWHHRENECGTTFDSDATYEGMASGVANYGEGICSECFDADDRMGILNESLNQVEI